MCLAPVTPPYIQQKMDERHITPRAPRRRARASLSMATPPNLTSTPFAAAGDSGGLKGIGVRQARRGRASFSMATSPLVVPGAVTAAGGAGESGQQEPVKDGSPWMGGRAESPSTVGVRAGVGVEVGWGWGG